MFTKASIRLTAWYVAILMALSLIFTTWLYIEATNEVRASLNAQATHSLARMLPNEDVARYLEQQFNDSRARIIGSLVLLNIGVFITGTFASYFLARRTLQPIEDALDAQNRFTADASHELRTPLTTMKTEIEVALRDKKLPIKDARDLLQSNVEEIDRLSKLADGLLILARTGDKPDLQKVPLADVAKKAAKRFDAIAKQKDMTITRQLHDVTALADAAHIDAITGILLDNAIKYGTPNTAVTLAVAKHDNQAYVTVHNDGPGIAADDLPHVFERFYRVDTSRTGGKTAGYGLGLSIAYKLATHMNGTIAVKNDTTGTTFTLRVSVA